MNTHRSKFVRGRISTKIIAGVGAIALAAVLLVGGGSPATAAGSFSVKHTAWGCTEGDYKGSSYSAYISGAAWAYAVTSYQYPICAPSNSSIPGARPIAGSTLGTWQYGITSSVTTRLQKPNGSLTAYGHHSVGGAFLRNT